MMKYIYILFLSFLYPVSVTFSVDMQEQYLSSGNVYLAGSDSLTQTFFGSYADSVIINPWTPEDVELVDIDFTGVFSKTIELQSNITYVYKFVNGLNYELEGESDRFIYIANQDTILDIACYNKVDESCDDMNITLVPVTFFVDMQQTVISDNGVGLLGANDSFTNFGYDFITGNPIPVYDPSYLSLQDINNENIYSITLLLEPGVNYQYKFVNGNDFSGAEQSQRSITVSPVSGYYLNEVCFNSYDDCENFTTLLNTLTFKTDVSNAVSDNGLELGDMLIVKWGYGETQPIERLDTLQLMPFSYIYKIDIDSVYISSEVDLYYQYYKVIDDNEYREIFFNFDYLGSDIVLAERRFFDFEDSLDSQDILVEDVIDSNVAPRRMPVFANTESIGEELEVTWSIDLRPAYYQILFGDTLFDIQGTYHVDNVDSLYEWGVWINGPASTPANGQAWTEWGPTLQGTTSKKMWDDGTHGDSVADDHIYTLILTYDESSSISQECKFGIKGGDNESSYGLNHYVNINSFDPNIYVYWGSINPIFYNRWDYDTNQPILDFCDANGDTNQDGIINVIDIILLMNVILDNPTLSSEEICLFDLNDDNIINVIDIIVITQIILED